MIRYLLSRIGCVMLIFGSIALVVGIAAESSGQPAFNFLSIGLALSFFGFLLWNRLRPKKEQPPRGRRSRNRRGRDPDEEQNHHDDWEH